MPTRPFRASLVAFALLFECVHLGWEASHGGIVSHHLFQQADLPALSNLWGLLVLPALAAWAGRRWFRGPDAMTTTTTRDRRRITLGFVIPLTLGAALSLAFVFHQQTLTEVIFFGTMLLALLLPAHRAESLFGFVLGMSWVFGAVLPTLIGGVIAGLSWLVRSLARLAWRTVRPA